MRSSFFGLNISVSGLFAAQRNLDVVNHNVTNASTPGYSRQAGVQTANRAISMYDGTGMYGTGSSVNSVVRIRDEFLDYKYWSESQSSGEWTTKYNLLKEVQATFNEPSLESTSGSGFSTVFNDFYSSLQDLSKTPGDEGLRSIVKQRGVTLAKYFNTTATQFEELQSDINNRIKTKVVEVNNIANQIKDLNKQIFTAEVGGDTANDLRDQRTLLVDKLSKIVDVQANEVVVGKRPDGSDNIHFTVSINGKNLVDHYSISELTVTPRDSSTILNPNEDIAGLYDITWKDTGAKASITGGELRGYLDIRDGNEGENNSPATKGIPYYIKKLNSFVRTFAMSFNEGYVADGSGSYTDGTGHADGYGLNSTSTGVRFFTMIDPTNGKNEKSSDFISSAIDSETGTTRINDTVNAYKKLTAKNFCVSDDILNDIKKISAAGTAGQQENATVLNAIIKDRSNDKLFSDGSPEDYMKALISNLGIDAQQAKTLTESQENIVAQVESERQQISGVSLDEEMSNMIKYQQCYNASARMITTMSEIYETLINRLGV